MLFGAAQRMDEWIGGNMDRRVEAKMEIEWIAVSLDECRGRTISTEHHLINHTSESLIIFQS